MLHVTPTSAVACVPTHVPAAHPDAELMDLWRRRELVSATAVTAWERLNAIKDAMVLPEPPEALFACDADEALGLRRWAVDHEPSGRPWYPVVGENTGGIATRLRRRQVRTVEVPFPPEHALHGTGDVIARQVLWPDAQARADAIVAAWDGWRARLAEIHEVSGAEAAYAEATEQDTAVVAIDVAIKDIPARTLDGVRIKAQLAHLDLDEDGEPWPELMTSLVRDLVALPTAVLPPRTPDPVLAAISETRVTLLEHIDACEAPDAETPDGDARRSAAGDAAFAAWNALMSTTPTTVAGVQVLARFVPEYIEAGGTYDDLKDHNRIFRLIAAADLPEGDVSDVHPIPTRIRTPEVAPWPMAAE